MKAKTKILILALCVAVLVAGYVVGTQARLNAGPEKDIDLRTALHYLNGDESNRITSKVSSITFGLNADYSHITAAYDGTAVKLEQDGTVYAYYVPDGANYDVYVLSDQKIYAPENSSNLFADMTRLTSFHGANLDTSRTTDMSFLFFDCTSLIALDVTGWDLSNVTTTTNLFGGDRLLTAITGLDSWDLSNVTDTSNMFADCASLEKLDGISAWDTGNVTAMECMFYNCRSLTDVDVSRWDVRCARDMWGMFHGCESLTRIDISRWAAENVTNTAELFDGCSSLTAITIPEGMATVGAYAFADCGSLSTVTFPGDAPKLSSDCFYGVTARAFYLNIYETWTEEVRQNYGGDITWQAHVIEEFTDNGDATCTEDGTRTGVCRDCGEVFVKPAPGTAGHTFGTDGRCTACGEADPDYVPSVTKPTLTLNYPTLAFEDEILYNVYFSVSDLSGVAEMGLVTFADRNAEGTVAQALEVIPGYVANADGSCTASTNGVPAKLLGDTMFFKVYARLTDGSYVYSDVVGYHAVAYANTILNNTASSAKAKALVVAMLNYGAAAQTYFNYNTHSLMNAGLTDTQQALVQDYDAAMVADVGMPDAAKAGQFVNSGGYSDIHPTVSFEGKFSINYYFTPKYTPDDGVTFCYWSLSDFNHAQVLTPENATGTVKMTSDTGVYTNPIQGIAAKQIDEPVYVAAVYSNAGTDYTTPVIGYSLGLYCKTVAAKGEAFGAATAVYGYYAKAYFA